MKMGNMSEEMKKIMAKWDNKPEPQTTTQEKGQPVQTLIDPNSYRLEIYNTIKNKPKLNCNQVLELMQKKHPHMGHSSISSQLTTMFQEFLLTRELVRDQNTHRDVYAYSVVDLSLAEQLRQERERRLAKAQARAERARQVKAEKIKAKREELQNQAQIPLPLETAPATPATVRTMHPAALNGLTAMQILQGINFAQAKELYKELKEAFGG
jgi:hypothetical protein